MTSKSVYVIADGDGRRKIGFSQNAQTRLAQLQAAAGGQLLLERHFVCGINQAGAVERLAHQLLAEKRLTGEWFDVTLEEAVAAIEEAIATVEAGGFRTRLTEPGHMSDLGVRWTEEEREALQAAAADKSLTISALVRMIVVEWLKRHGWLKSRRTKG